MIGRRIRPYSAPNDLPPIRRGLWAAVVVGSGLALVLWTWLATRGLWGPVPDNAPASTLRAILVFVVATVPVAVLVYGSWRFQLERLAFRPGPILVTPFADFTLEAGDRPGDPGVSASAASTPMAIRLTSLFQQHVVASRLYGATAIPSTGRSTDFLSVIERAGDAPTGFWGTLGRVPRILAPASAYQVECRILPPSPEDEGARVLLVELTRFPNSLVAPKIIRDATWERAVQRAAHWVAGVVLPRTRQVRYPPWTMWRGLRLPEELFDHYQRFQRHQLDRELDEAMADLREARRLDPGNLALRLELGKLQEQLGLQLEALATYDDIVGRASRGDRGLALQWNLPPDEWDVEGGEGPGEDKAWNDGAHITELGAQHPTVYVARYRHMLLLGMGDRLASQWWGSKKPGHQPLVVDGERVADARRDDCEHRAAHERLSGHSRRILRQRLSGRLPWVRDELLRRHLLSCEGWHFLGEDCPPGHTAQDMSDDLDVFLTTASLCSLELLLSERRADLMTPRSVRDVVSLRSLRLVLPWGVLRAGRAIASRTRAGGNPSLSVDPSWAGRSIVHKETRPDLLGQAGDGLFRPPPCPGEPPDLEKEAEWPPNPDVLRRAIGGELRSSFRTLHSWHEHYNAACAYALALLPRSSEGPQPSTDYVASIAQAAVTQLYKAVACGDSGFLASQREWLLTEDPDLDVLRGQDAFFDLEVATYGSVRATEQRGPQLVTWQIRTFACGLLLHVATLMSAEWERRLRHDAPAGPTDDTVRTWFEIETTAWEVVDALCFDHEDSTARHAAMTKWRGLLDGGAAEPPTAHPRFSRGRLGMQVAALDDQGHAPNLEPGLAGLIGFVIHQSTARFAAVVFALRRGGDDTCCSRSRPLVPRDHERALTNYLRATSAERQLLTVEERVQVVPDWTERSRKRWRAAVELFDDATPHTDALGKRWRHFASMFPP